MIKVGHLSEFPKNCMVKQYQGKTYEEAVKLAEKSEKEYISWYEQKPYGRSRVSTILVSYIMKENDAHI